MYSANATRAAPISDNTSICHHATNAAQVIDGEERAAALLGRIGAGMAQPDELAVIVVYLQGELLHGFCRLVQKALEARHG